MNWLFDVDKLAGFGLWVLWSWAVIHCSMIALSKPVGWLYGLTPADTVELWTASKTAQRITLITAIGFVTPTVMMLIVLFDKIWRFYAILDGR